MEACACQNGLISRKTPRIFIANSRKLMNIYEKCASYFPKTMAGGGSKAIFSEIHPFCDMPEFKLVSGACSVSLQIIVDENRSFESGTNPHPVSASGLETKLCKCSNCVEPVQLLSHLSALRKWSLIASTPPPSQPVSIVTVHSHHKIRWNFEL